MAPNERLPFNEGSSYLPRLLLWQVYFLFFLAGVVGWKYLSLGSAFFLILLFLFRTYQKFTLFFAISITLLGYCYTEIRTPSQPKSPPWLYAHLEQGKKNGFKSLEKISLAATVESATKLPTKKARIILTNVVMIPQTDLFIETSDPKRYESYSGKIIWNFSPPSLTTQKYNNLSSSQTDNSSSAVKPKKYAIPLTGERIQIDAHLMRLSGFANKGTLDTEEYWNAQNVWLRGKTNASEGYLLLENAPWHQKLRYELQQKCYALLPKKNLLSVSNEFSSGRSIEKTSLLPGAGMLPALLFGDRSFIRLDDKNRIAKSTLAHSLALSGLHLGYMASFGFAAAWLLTRIYPPVLLTTPKYLLGIFLSFPLAVIYLWLGNAPISLQRSFLMLSFWALLFIMHRPKVFLDGLFAALFVLLIINPLALFDISLQLSALSIAVIALILPVSQRWKNEIAMKWTAKQKSTFLPASTKQPRPTLRVWQRLFLTAGQMLFISFCIQFALSPLTSRAFGNLGIWFPLNLLWLPVLGVVVMPFAFAGMLFLSLGLSYMAEKLFYISTLPCDALLSLLKYMEDTRVLWAPSVLRLSPLSIGGFWLICLGLPALFCVGKKSIVFIRNIFSNKSINLSFHLLLNKGLPSSFSAKCCILGIFLFFSPLFHGYINHPSPGVHIKILDVGAAQAVLLEWRIGHEKGRALIDAGGLYPSGFSAGKSIVIPTLTDNSLPRLDMAITTHSDADHLGGMIAVIENIHIKRYAGNGDTAAKTLFEGEKRALELVNLTKTTLRRGDEVVLANGLSLFVLWPDPPPGIQPGSRGRNNDSLVMRLAWQNEPLALLCGDIEKGEVRLFADTYKNDVPAKVLLLPHHGSHKSYWPNFYKAVAPSLVIASAGASSISALAKNPVYAYFELEGIPLYSTATDGQVQIYFSTPKAEPVVTVARTKQHKKISFTPLRHHGHTRQLLDRTIKAAEPFEPLASNE